MDPMDNRRDDLTSGVFRLYLAGVFDFFAGVNFNLTWNGFFVSDSLKENIPVNQDIDRNIDLIGNEIINDIGEKN